MIYIKVDIPKHNLASEIKDLVESGAEIVASYEQENELWTIEYTYPEDVETELPFESAEQYEVESAEEVGGGSQDFP